MHPACSLRLCSLLLLALFFVSNPVKADVGIISGSRDVYIANICQRAGKYWIPPRGIPSGIQTRIELRLSPQGSPLHCKIIKSSGNKSFDSSACHAVMQTKNFGQTPEHTITEVQITFQSAREKPVPRLFSEKKRLAQAETKTNHYSTNEQHVSVHPASVITRWPPENKTLVLPQREAPYSGPAKLAQVFLSGSNDTAIRNYQRLIWEKAHRHIWIPQDVPDGSYSLVIGVIVSSDGRVIQANLLRSSGYASLDSNYLKAVRQISRLPAPDRLLGNRFEVNFSLHCIRPK